jgi:hypothetical protein
MAKYTEKPAKIKKTINYAEVGFCKKSYKPNLIICKVKIVPGEF